MVDSTNPRILADNIKTLAARDAGSSVEANPEGVATADLEKLEVDGVIYEIPVYSPGDYSTTERLTGRKWIDGSNEYEKVIVLPESLTVNSNAFIDVPNVTFSNIKTFTDVTLLKNDGACLKAAAAVVYNDTFRILQTRGTSQVVDIIIVKYVYNSTP